MEVPVLGLVPLVNVRGQVEECAGVDADVALIGNSGDLRRRSGAIVLGYVELGYRGPALDQAAAWCIPGASQPHARSGWLFRSASAVVLAELVQCPVYVAKQVAAYYWDRCLSPARVLTRQPEREAPLAIRGDVQQLSGAPPEHADPGQFFRCRHEDGGDPLLLQLAQVSPCRPGVVVAA